MVSTTAFPFHWIFLLFLTIAVQGERRPIVHTSTGPIQGIEDVHDGHVAMAFRGIPFAEPPIGELRWAMPRFVKNWTETKDVSKFAAGCVQHCVLPPGMCPDTISEDCLTLDIYTPDLEPKELMPIFFFIPGGRFLEGTGEALAYDAGMVSSITKAVWVAINYRLGVFGFARFGKETPGNYAIADQIMALQWVRTNAKKFGGDPNQVTYAGESAGGESVYHLMTSPYAIRDPPFTRAVIESGPFTLPTLTISESESLSASFLEDLNCKDVECARAASMKAVLDAGYKAGEHLNVLHPMVLMQPWCPVIDGDYILGQPITLMEKGQMVKVPVLLGTMKDEAIMFVYILSSLSDLEYEAFMMAAFGTHAPKVLKMYPGVAGGDNRVIASKMLGDYLFGCTTRAAARAVMTYGNDAFLFHFEHKPPSFIYGPDPSWDCCRTPGVVCHGSELPYLFHQDGPVPDTHPVVWFNFTAEEEQMSQQMLEWWGNFMWTGSPNTPHTLRGETSTFWPPMKGNNYPSMKIATPCEAIEAYRKEACDMWDEIGYHHWDVTRVMTLLQGLQ